MRRRKLTDLQRFEENVQLGSDAIDKQNQSKVKYNFMQKYYHKGAFFQDANDPLLNRDYNIAVGEDLVDKNILHPYMQKRRGEYGRKGQSKYTHLTDQDTTNFDPLFKPDSALQAKLQPKQFPNNSTKLWNYFYYIILSYIILLFTKLLYYLLIYNYSLPNTLPTSINHRNTNLLNYSLFRVIFKS